MHGEALSAHRKSVHSRNYRVAGDRERYSTCKLARVIRKSGLKVGIIAVDPSSPFTGGALLGDRVRMSELGDDSDIYIRSMATRGFLGGMAKATGDVVKVLDAFGKDVIS